MRFLEEAEDWEKLEVWIAVVRQSLQTFGMSTGGLETSVKGTRSGARPNSEVLVCDQARAELLVIKHKLLKEFRISSSNNTILWTLLCGLAFSQSPFDFVGKFFLLLLHIAGDKFRISSLDQQIHFLDEIPYRRLSFYSNHNFFLVSSWCSSVIIQLDFLQERSRELMSLFLTGGKMTRAILLPIPKI